MKLMVKKLIILGLVFIITLTGFTGCKSKDDKSTSKNGDDVNVSSEKPTSTVGNNTSDETEPTAEPTVAPDMEEGEVEQDGDITSNFIYDGKPIDSAVFEDCSYPIVFNRPMYQVIQEGWATMFNRGDTLFIAYVPIWEEYPNLKVKDAFPIIEQDLYDCAEMYDLGIYSQELTMDKTEEMTINGVDCLRFEGKLTVKSGENDTPRDLYSIGYTFVKANIPCMIIGVVVEDEQTDAHKEEVTHNVDEMMKTLRDEE